MRNSHPIPGQNPLSEHTFKLGPGMEQKKKTTFIDALYLNTRQGKETLKVLFTVCITKGLH